MGGVGVGAEGGKTVKEKAEEGEEQEGEVEQEER